MWYHLHTFCLEQKGGRNLSDFMKFGIAASHEALLDAGWSETTLEQKLRTVLLNHFYKPCLGSLCWVRYWIR